MVVIHIVMIYILFMQGIIPHKRYKLTEDYFLVIKYSEKSFCCRHASELLLLAQRGDLNSLIT